MSKEINETSPLQQRFAEVFARLHDQDIEQFYAHYQLWVLRQRVPFLEKQIETLREHIVENQHQIEQLQPPAIALAVLARLQSNGVKDIALLDQMLERGEDWLDRMMQRLDYCEQVEDFIQGDYTQWCVNSLEGAYDWIDSLRDAPIEETPPSQAIEQPAAADIQATEELLLQKLSIDDEEAMLEVTLKQLAIQPTQAVEGTAEAKEQPAVEEVAEAPAGEQQAELVAEAESKEETIGDSEPQAVTTSELQAEMSGWQDLESPEEPSAPWYSVSLETDAAPQSEQAQTMNDWITILQAESPAPEETSEVAALPAESEEQAEIAEPEEAEVSSEEQVGQESVPGEELAPQEDKPEVISESEEEPALEENEVVEVKGEPEQGDVSVSEAMPVENPSVEGERGAENEAAEATASAQTETAETEGAAYILSSEGAEGELIDAAKAIEFLSIAEEPDVEIEELEAVETDTTSSEPPADVEPPEEAEVHVEEEIAPTSAEQQAEGDAQVEEAEPSIAAVEQEETKEAEPQGGQESRPFREQGGQETRPFRKEEGQEQEEQGISSPQEEEAQGQEMSSIANAVEEEQKEAPLLTGVGEMQETAPSTGEDEQGTSLVKENKAAEQSPELEESAIANDILGPEGEQLAWYEYLEMDEQGSIAPSESGEEQVEPEGRPSSDETEPSEDATEMPELHEFVVAIEGEQAPASEETMRREEPTQIEEEQIEIEGWQTWSAQQEDDDKTLPMPLKEIEQEQDLPANVEPEPPVTMSEVMEPMGADESVELSEPVASPDEPLPAAAAGEIIVMDRQPSTSEAEEAPAQSVQAPPITPLAQVEERPKKRGFWQRLFGWMGKK